MANQTGGTVVWNLDVDDSKFRGGIAKAKTEASGLGDSFEKSERNASKSFSSLSAGLVALGSTAAGVFASIGAGAVVLSLVRQASELQSIRASFESMTGSAETATQVLQDLNKFSFKTAFSTEDINKAAKILLGFGVSTKDLLKRMQQIGDVAGATGSDLSGLSLVIGQVFAQGRVQAEDFYQIINTGAGRLGGALKDEVAKRGLGDIKQAFQDGTVTADIFFDVLDKANEQGSFAFEGAIKQADTFNGRLSNLIETLSTVGLEVLGVDKTSGQVQGGGPFDRLSQGVLQLGDLLTKNKDKLIEFGNLLINGVAKGAEAFGKGFQFIAQILPSVIEFIASNREGLKLLAEGLLIAAGIVGFLAGAILTGLAGALALVTGLLDFAKRSAEEAARVLFGLGIVFENLPRVISAQISVAVNIVRSLPGQILNALGDIGNLLFDAGRRMLEGLGRGIESAVDGVKKKLKDFSQSSLDTIKNFFGIRSPSRVMAGIGVNLTEGLVRGIESGANSVNNALTGLSGNVVSTVDAEVVGGSRTGGGVVINETNHFHTDMDIEAHRRAQAWRLANI